MPDAAAREWKSMVFTFLMMQNALGKWHAKNRMHLFNITMKSHYFAHMGLNAHHINPRLGYCFQGEDYMAKIKAITAASARGNNVYQVSGKATAKYCRGLQLVFEDGRSLPGPRELCLHRDELLLELAAAALESRFLSHGIVEFPLRLVTLPLQSISLAFQVLCCHGRVPVGCFQL